MHFLLHPEFLTNDLTNSRVAAVAAASHASERGAERIESLSFHYRTHLEERNAKIDKLTEENLALRKQAAESPSPP